MQYDSFLDYITTQGCIWLRSFGLPHVGEYYHNNSNGKTAFLKQDFWVPWIVAIAFCRDIGIEVPPELKPREADFDKLGLLE